MADKDTDTTPDAEVEGSAAAETSTEPKTLAAALDAAPEAEVTEEKAPEADAEVDAAAAEPAKADEEDADPDVDEVFNKRFTKDGKLDKKALAKALKENEARAQSVDPTRYQQAEAFLADMRELYNSDPAAKKLIDDFEAKKRGTVQVRSWPEVQAECRKLHAEGKHDEAQDLYMKHNPEIVEMRQITRTVKAEYDKKASAESNAEVAAFTAQYKPTNEESAVMVQIINLEAKQGKPKRPLPDILADAVVHIEETAKRAEVLKRRGVTVAGKPAATSKAPAPTPAGSRSVAPSKKVTSGDPDLDDFFDKADKHLGVEHKK